MCTVTVHRRDGRLLVTMNRDERRFRASEIPPSNWGSWVGPRDGDAGGAWIGVNSDGTVACMLNNYDAYAEVPAGKADSAPSRGRIVPELLELGDFDSIDRFLTNEFDPGLYMPFTMLIADIRQGVRWAWPGVGSLERESLTGEWEMLSSSSWNGQRVLSWRREQFANWLAAGAPFFGVLPTLHVLKPRDMEEWAFLMERSESHTRSITQIAVDPAEEEVRLLYWADPHTRVQEPDAQLGISLNHSAGFRRRDG